MRKFLKFPSPYLSHGLILLFITLTIGFYLSLMSVVKPVFAAETTPTISPTITPIVTPTVLPAISPTPIISSPAVATTGALLVSPSPTATSYPTPTPLPFDAINYQNRPSSSLDHLFSQLLPTPLATASPHMLPQLLPTYSPSAQLKIPLQIYNRPKSAYMASESITFQAVTSDGADLQVDLFDPKNEKVNLNIDKEALNNITTIRIEPSLELKPGKYQIKLKDSIGSAASLDFLWGTVSLDLNRTIYQPGERAVINLSLTDDKGEIVCDALINMKIKGPASEDTLSTKDNTITSSPDCPQHGFSDKPDFQTVYQIPSTAGLYDLEVSVGNYTVSDSFLVRDYVPLLITRKSSTRLMPNNLWYPMTLSLTAREDFTGVITDTIPESIDIAVPKDKSTHPFDSIETVSTWYNKGSILGIDIPPLAIPFETTHELTLGFGDNLKDPGLIRLYSQFGLTGHDGLDFDLPVGTPVLAADSGMVVLAGVSDYGQTVVIQHDWGRSYYGHLSKIDVIVGQRVTKGTKIALSGNTGLTTGAHLHFGIKPNKNDIRNGYYGKINPLPYLYSPKDNLPQSLFTTSQTGKVKKIRWNVSLKKGETLNIGYQLKTPNVSSSSYLVGPISFATATTSTTDEGLWQLTTENIPQRGALFDSSNTSSNFPMENIDPKLLDVPSDFPPLSASLDTDLKGSYAATRLDSATPSWQMTVASSSGTTNYLKVQLSDTISNNNPQTRSNYIDRNNVLKDTDMRFETYDGYMNQIITLQKDTAEKVFSLSLDISPNLKLEDYSGHVMVKDAQTDEEFFLLRFPQGIDAKNQRIDYKWKIKSEENNRSPITENRKPKTSLILYPNRAWQLQKAVYPITIFAPVNLVAWNEAAVAVGNSCPGVECEGEDGSIGDVRPIGFHWSKETLTHALLVKLPKLKETEREEYSSQTIAPDDEQDTTKFPAKEKARLFSKSGLARYGIDYTAIAKPQELSQIRDLKKKVRSPKLDIRKIKNPIIKKGNPLLSVIPKEKVLAYQGPNMIQKFLARIFPPAKAVTGRIIKSIGSAAGRDYTSIGGGTTCTGVQWEACEDGDLVTATEIHTGYLYKDSTFALTAANDIDDSTTNASYYMELTAAPSDRHRGIPSQGVIIDCQTNAISAIVARDDSTRLSWFSAMRCDPANVGAVDLGAATGVLVENVIVFNYTNATNTSVGFRTRGLAANQSWTIRNCITFDGDNYGILHSGSTGTNSITVNNCTIDGNNDTTGRGVDGNNDNATVKNTISMNNKVDFYQITTAATNISADTTGTIVSKTRANQYVDPDNATSADSDFHLKSGSDAINAGTDLSTDFTNDIDDTPRYSGSGWDIGADEYSAQLIDVQMRHGKYFNGSGEQPFRF